MLRIILVEFRTISIFKENITLKVVLVELELFLVQTSTDYKKKKKNHSKRELCRTGYSANISFSASMLGHMCMVQCSIIETGISQL